MSKGEFGLYGISLAILLLGAGLIGSYFGTQFTVNVSEVPASDRGEFAIGYTAAACATAAAGSVIIFGGIELLRRWRYVVVPEIASLTLSIGIAGSIYCIRDILNRVAFANRRESTAFGSALGNAVAVFGALLALYLLNVDISVPLALSIYGIGQLTGGLYAAGTLVLPWRQFRPAWMRRAWSNSWRNGRWSVLSSIAYSLRTQAYNFVVPAVLGVAALGEINAARVLVAPALMALPPIKDVMLPRLADKHALGLPALLRVSASAAVALGAVGIVYSLLLLAALPTLAPLLLGAEYANVTWMVIVWCFAMLAIALREGLSMTLQAARHFKELMWMNALFGILSVVLCYLLSLAAAKQGAILSIAIAEFGLAAMLVLVARRSVASSLRR